jgi:hypothetical protein
LSGEPTAWDKLTVAETVYRYATGVDTRDWVLYRSIFADQVDIDFSSYNGRPAARTTADDWVARARRLFSGLAATQHSMTNPTVTLNGDRATCVMYMRAEHVLTQDDPDAWFTIGGYYTDQLVRAGEGWLLTGVTLTVWWRRGRPQIMEDAVKLGAENGANQNQ